MSLMRSLIIAVVLVTLMVPISISFFTSPTVAIATETLLVGSLAPKLNVEHWVQHGEGKLPKITNFEPGKAYVVEFWATTCGPCVQSMPHLAELQTKYADKGLQIVSISSEPLDVVTSFLENELADASGQKKKIGDITRVYSLTTDPDGSSEKDYMLASNQDGIPCAFIVGKDAKIEWMGHPMDMDNILESVLQDKWDRKKYIEEQKLIEEIQKSVGGLAKRKKYAEAVAAIDGYIAKVSDRRIQFGLYKSKIDLQIRSSAGATALTKSYQELFATCVDEPLFVQDVAWSAYENFVEGRIKNKELIRMAIEAIEKALPQVEGPAKANLFDTIGRLYSAIGETEPAIKAQSQAVQLSDGSDQESFKEFLLELQAESKKTKK